MINTLDLRLQEQTNEEGDHYLVVELVIDGQPLVAVGSHWYGIDLEEYQKSIISDGEFFILTCGCGVALCVGIAKGIEVRHVGDFVYWHILQPEPERTFVFTTQNYEAAFNLCLDQGNAINDALVSQGKTDFGIVAFESERVFHPIPRVKQGSILDLLSDLEDDNEEKFVI